MGQVQSEAAADVDPQGHPVSPAASINSLISEASAYGNDANEAFLLYNQKTKTKTKTKFSLYDCHQNELKALECPCIADLRKGPCGIQFSEAFVCYLKSTVAEKGSDCVHPFVSLQNCIKANPDAFPKELSEDDEVRKEEKLTQDYKIIPPSWSKESLRPKSNL
ncbi:mitochondrial intermembrane space import and assembly protein 40 homolog [Argentina anserina]|uniref:mitochondrial intermembrane space import and assembly protein 40 homolog n=1 Tax=Argentina anserina TaxID=57926 RepID=UPI00217644D3|nr:mitochondrial intermembrane space import and assembly protein 40 homolog [Potentilla anserina]